MRARTSRPTAPAAQFIVDGIEHDEPGVLALFEKRPAGYLRTTTLGHHVIKVRGSERSKDLRPVREHLERHHRQQYEGPYRELLIDRTMAIARPVSEST